MILIGIGSNLPVGELSSRELAHAAFGALQEGPLRLLARSRLWHTKPVPDTGQDWFVNAAASIATTLDPEALLDHLHGIEEKFGRTRETLNAPRTLDLDLIDFEGRISAPDARAVTPHPRATDRAFVLKPLAEVAPGWRHPVSGQCVTDLIRALPADQLAEPLE